MLIDFPPTFNLQPSYLLNLFPSHPLIPDTWPLPPVFFLFAIHYSLFTIYYSLLTIHYS
jgi:hypothetical protein